MKKSTVAFVGVGLLVAAVIVYAWASDTDGGFNPFQKGTCSYTLPNGSGGNLTDFCQNTNYLFEYYPTGNGSNATCTGQSVYCPQYDFVENSTNQTCTHTYRCSLARCKETVACY